MELKADGDADLHEIDRFDRGVGWIAYPGEAMERASHAIAVPNEESETDDVWVFDPVDAPGVDDLLADLGTVAGVVVGLDRHKRDSAAIATRHDVPVYVADWMTGCRRDRRPRRAVRLAAGGLGVRGVSDPRLHDPPWQEVGFFDGETLIVPESLGSASYFRGDRERLGVHPMLRLMPPPIEALSGLNPERVRVGHGVGVDERAALAVEDALSGSRRKAPGLYARTLRSALGI